MEKKPQMQKKKKFSFVICFYKMISKKEKKEKKTLELRDKTELCGSLREQHKVQVVFILSRVHVRGPRSRESSCAIFFFWEVLNLKEAKLKLQTGPQR